MRKALAFLSFLLLGGANAMATQYARALVSETYKDTTSTWTVKVVEKSTGTVLDTDSSPTVTDLGADLGAHVAAAFTTLDVSGLTGGTAGKVIIYWLDDDSPSNIAAMQELYASGDGILYEDLEVALARVALRSDATHAELITALNVAVGAGSTGDYAVGDSQEGVNDTVLKPTTTGRTLDVTATGAAGIDWSNIENPASTVDLSATDIRLADTATSVTTATTVTNVTNNVGVSSFTQAALAQFVTDDTGETSATSNSVADIAQGAASLTAVDVRTEMDSNSTQLAAIVEDTNELQGDWTNGGRLDLLLDAALADTNELQGDWTDGGRLDLLLDATLADTNELQTDDYPTTLATLSTFDASTDTVDVGKILGTALSESTSGRIAGNMSVVFDNADAVTTKTADDIGADVGAISLETPAVMVDTTISGAPTSQKVFVLAAGSADDDAYNGHMAMLTDQSTATQKSAVRIADYDGGTRTVTLADTPKFTIAASDVVEVLAVQPPALTTSDSVSQSRTLFIDGRRSRSIVELNAWSSGTVTIAIDMDSPSALNPGTTISSLDSVTVTNDSDASTTTTSNLTLQQNARKANFNVAAISSASTHTVSATITTSDANTLVLTGKIRVY